MRVFLLLSLLLLVTACNRKNEDAILARGQSFRLIRTDYYGVPANASLSQSTRYEYDANNLLREVVTSENADGPVYSKLVHNWVKSNILRIEHYFTNPPWSSSIQPGLPLKMHTYNEVVFNPDTTVLEQKQYMLDNNQPQYRSSTKYEYDPQKRLTRLNNYSLDGKLGSYTVFEYDTRDNVIRETLYSNVSNTAQPNIVTTYEYDNAPNPHHTTQMRTTISWYMSRNNIIRQKSANLASGINSDEQWRYEYRPDGYPARMIYEDGRKEEFIYSR
ncbi:hypothetical protein GCM10027347_37270 [Larkinella harenae]